MKRCKDKTCCNPAYKDIELTKIADKEIKETLYDVDNKGEKYHILRFDNNRCINCGEKAGTSDVCKKAPISQ